MKAIQKQDLNKNEKKEKTNQKATENQNLNKNVEIEKNRRP